MRIQVAGAFTLVAMVALASSCVPREIVATVCNGDVDCPARERCEEGRCTPVLGQPDTPEPGPLQPETPEPSTAEPSTPEPSAPEPSDAGVDSCGDGVIDATETCDDGNRESADGCSSICAIEPGAFCSGEPSRCEIGTCQIGSESFAAGALDPDDPCRRCLPSVDRAAFSTLADGSACDDGDFCNGDDVCLDGECGAITGVRDCPATTPRCDADRQACVCEAAESCDDGAFCSGIESCVDGQCRSPAPVICDDDTVCVDETESCMECATAAECSPIAPVCLVGVCVEECPPPLFDDGTGRCAEACAEGWFAQYADVDEDGLGGATIGCGLVESDLIPGDCDDGAAAVGGPVPSVIDADGDGFTAPGPLACQTTAPSPPPVIAYRPYRSQSVDADGDATGGQCSALDRIERKDDSGARCTHAVLQGRRGTRFSDFGFAFPASAVVLGLEVQIRRSALSFNGSLRDQIVRLRAPDGAQGENFASDTPWTDSMTTVVYGGPTQTWGLDLTPALLSDPEFGIEIFLDGSGGFGGMITEFDTLVMLAYVDTGTDCDDDDITSFSENQLYVDDDGDGYAGGDGLSSVRCGGTELEDGFTPRSKGDDCLDTDSRVHPDQGAYFDTPNADGSFDYDCDNTVTKKPVSQVSSCSCDVLEGCMPETETLVAATGDCGSPFILHDACESTAISMCLEAAQCQPTDVQSQVRCR